MAQDWIGLGLKRKEDRRLITGQGTYADDLAFPGLARAVFVRSPHARARILSIDTDAAREMPGVLAVLTGADVLADGLAPIPHATGSSKMGSDMPLKNRDGSERLTTPQFPMPADEARFVGDAVAMVVAETLAEAKDAAEAIVVDWEVLPALTRAIDALEPSAPQIWPQVPGNLALDGDLGSADEAGLAFEKAAHCVRLTTQVQRVTGVHMEPRSSTAEWDSARAFLTIHASHGIGVVQMRSEVARTLGLSEDAIRIAAPLDVGGNFGTRNATYPDFVLIGWAAKKLGRPVRYTAERQEALLSDYQGRDLHVEAELALDADGKFLAYRSVNTSNVGAYTTSFVPLNKGSQMLTSVYDVPAGHVRARAAVTNTPATIPYRSAGRPEAIFVIERLIDVAARQCGFDRIDLRRRNIIPAEKQPYRNPFGVTYDNGDYEGVMDIALRLADWENFPARRAESQKRGLCRGIGFANYIETTSGAPRERSDITVSADGFIDVIIGTQSSGQGHETSFAQVVAQWLGVDFDDVRVRYGDTAFVKAGGGSHSGRSMRFGSIVMREASTGVIDKARAIAATLFEVALEDVAFEAGVLRAAGTNKSISLYEVAARAENGEGLPPDLSGPLSAFCDRVIPGLAYPYGAAVCEVEVDAETGSVAIVRYTSVDDVGRAINPMILHGQTHGGIVMGAGQALCEHMVYDPASGQNLSASFMDYAMPRASDFPSFTTDLSEVPAKSHPLGIRPGGEGGTTPALATTINAIVDALADFGVTHIDMPATPLRVWRAIQDAKSAQGAARH